MDELKQFLKERDEALVSLDLEYARRKFPQAADETLLMALHKARVEVLTMPETLRRKSMEWLKERGYGPMTEVNWPEDGSLPE